jgi:hypothetical protein
MATNRYKAKIKLSSGSVQEVYVEADNINNARAMIETQYGKKSIIAGPFKV